MAAASPIPPRLRVIRISTQAPGSANRANQAIPFGMCLLEWWPISWASTTRTSASENVPSSIVLQRTTRRDGPKPRAYAFAWLVVPLTSSTSIGMPETPCFCSNAFAERFSSGFLSEVVSPRYG